MRRKTSFVLRLYVDSRTPKVLTGDLQALPNRRVYSFKSNAGLIKLLIRLAKPPLTNLPAEENLEYED
jgi:hypothetical protein